MSLSRRQVLGSLAAVVAAAGVGGYVRYQLPPASPGRHLLDDREVELVERLAEAMFPPGNALGVAAAGLGLGARVDELLGDTLDPMVGPVFRHILQGLDDGTRISRGQAFRTLPLPDRVDVLTRWADNSLFPRRAAYDALRLVMGMAYFNEPAVLGAIGWRARCAAGAV